MRNYCAFDNNKNSVGGDYIMRIIKNINHHQHYKLQHIFSVKISFLAKIEVIITIIVIPILLQFDRQLKQNTSVIQKIRYSIILHIITHHFTYLLFSFENQNRFTNDHWFYPKIILSILDAEKEKCWCIHSFIELRRRPHLRLAMWLKGRVLIKDEKSNEI